MSLRCSSNTERKFLLPGMLLLVLAPPAVNQTPKRTVTYVSPTECRNSRPGWRWSIKTDRDPPPAQIPRDHEVTPADIGKWPVPGERLMNETARVGREKEWYALTGRVFLVEAEADGDIHIQLAAPDAQDPTQTVAEIPLHPDDPNSNRSKMRRVAFGWSDEPFPFTITRFGHALHLLHHPIIRVLGKAFFDGNHAAAYQPSRRPLLPHVTVWEIHPITELKVLRED